MMTFFRGDFFCVAYAHLSLGLIPSNLNVMALIATTTCKPYKAVSSSVMLKNPVLIGVEPYCDNITFKVKALVDVEIFCASVAEEIQAQGLN